MRLNLLARLLSFGVLFIGLLPLPAHAAEPCIGPTPDIQVMLRQEPATTRHERSREEVLNSIATPEEGRTSATRRAAREAARSYSNFSSKTALDLDIEYNNKKMADGNYCVSIHRLKVYVTLTDNVVDVATELAPNSCPFNELVAHEMKHYALDTELLREWERMLPRQLEAALSSSNSIQSNSQPQAKAMLASRTTGKVQQQLEALQTLRANKQSKIEIRDGLAAVRHACNVELAP